MGTKAMKRADRVFREIAKNGLSAAVRRFGLPALKDAIRERRKAENR